MDNKHLENFRKLSPEKQDNLISVIETILSYCSQTYKELDKLDSKDS